jgi:acylphosphatase
MKVQLECIIRGRVQGVMFRDFVARKARSLEVAGTVQNRLDGSVVVVATGEKEKLEKLLAYLYKGPILTRIRVQIDSIETAWKEPQKDFNNFTIVY